MTTFPSGAVPSHPNDDKTPIPTWFLIFFVDQLGGSIVLTDAELLRLSETKKTLSIYRSETGHTTLRTVDP
jgi:hypothetical protein